MKQFLLMTTALSFIATSAIAGVSKEDITHGIEMGNSAVCNTLPVENSANGTILTERTKCWLSIHKADVSSGVEGKVVWVRIGDTYHTISLTELRAAGTKEARIAMFKTKITNGILDKIADNNVENITKAIAKEEAKLAVAKDMGVDVSKYTNQIAALEEQLANAPTAQDIIDLETQISDNETYIDNLKEKLENAVSDTQNEAKEILSDEVFNTIEDEIKNWGKFTVERFDTGADLDKQVQDYLDNLIDVVETAALADIQTEINKLATSWDVTLTDSTDITVAIGQIVSAANEAGATEGFDTAQKWDAQDLAAIVEAAGGSVTDSNNFYATLEDAEALVSSLKGQIATLTAKVTNVHANLDTELYARTVALTGNQQLVDDGLASGLSMFAIAEQYRTAFYTNGIKGTFNGHADNNVGVTSVENTDGTFTVSIEGTVTNGTKTYGAGEVEASGMSFTSALNQAVEDALSNAVETAYADGYIDGFNDGYETGYVDGYQAGYADGSNGVDSKY